MATGPLPSHPTQLLASPRMRNLVSIASEKFDMVIIDAPPVLGLADAPILGSMAAGTLFVLAAGETRRGVIKASLKRLYFARSNVVGAVLNKFDFRHAKYGYGYGYGALEHYGYGAQAVAQLERASNG